VNDPAPPGFRNTQALQTPPDFDATTLSDASSQIPERDLGSIGPYRLLSKIGEGGMGSVWLAEQTSPMKRQVAIKVVKSGRFSEQALQRFDLERQTLAIMNHPAIAKVFDAGSTPEGQPYFVMEYVSGLPITQYCNQKRFSPSERIALMIKVCEGVQHAHQKAIMHRDLKPSNILVTEVDGKPLPRIIDFGIAKATQAAAADVDATLDMLTGAGGSIGTPGYMSPEQADPSILDVDTRTDVYSLGVVLYELLTATLPFDPRQWKTKPLHEVLRQLHEEDPQRPSTRISTDTTGAAKKIGIEQHKLVSQLRGDLDWITLKALERERDRRYSSPADLAADLSRYLRNQPIAARPPSVVYLTRKFIRRNRLAVAFTAALLLVVVGFAISMTIERNRARREAETSKRVSDFMTHMFEVSDPSESRGNAVTARELLDKASGQIEKELGQDPLVQARLMQTMGATYRGLGLYDQARALLEHAVAIQTHALGAQNPETLQSMALLGVVYESLGRYADSEKLLHLALAGQQKVLGAENPETMGTVSYLTDTLSYEGHYAEAEGLIRRTIALQQRTLGPENGATLRSMRSLITNLAGQNRFADAEKQGRETLAIEVRVLGPDHPGTLWTMNNLALALQAEGRNAEAEKLFRDSYTTSARVLGPDHTNTLAALGNLAYTLQLEGHYAEAEAIQRDVLERTRKTLGPENPDTLNAMSDLAVTYGMESKFAESEKLLREGLQIDMRTLGPESPNTLRMMTNLAGTLALEKRADECIATFEKLLQLTAKSEGSARADANYQYGDALAVLGRPDPAFQHLQDAVKFGFSDPHQLTTDDNLKPLQKDPRFQALIDEIQKNHPAPAK
jgi:serine/threonine protein kinase